MRIVGASRGIKIVIAVGLALCRETLAAPPDNPDPALAPWFESLKQPGTGASCCSIADCRTETATRCYSTVVGRCRFHSGCASRRIGSSTELTTRRTAPWFASRLRPAFSVSCARARVKGQREAPNSPCALLRPACPIEFGTGFLPPETGASKRDLKWMSPRRDRKLETTTREKSPQKTTRPS